MTTVTTTDLLTDDMLARFDERAPDLRPREPLLRRGLGGAAGDSGYLLAAVPDRVRRRGPRRSTSTRKLRAPARLRRPGDRAGRQHALLLDRASPPTCCADGRRLVPLDPRAGRRGRGLRAPSTARPATTCRCCCRRPTAERVDGGWEISGHKIFGSLIAGVDLRRLPRDGHLRSRRTRRSSTASCRATREGFQIVDTWDTLGMRATQSQDTVLDKAFVPDELVAAGVPGRVRRRRPVPGRRSSPGR